jgi:hypothetical protein
MAITPATAFFDTMTQLTGNTAGAIQALPNSNLVGGRVRGFFARLTMAAQASGTVFGVARLPLPASLIRVQLLTSVTLATATIALGNAANGNSAIYLAARVLTVTTPVIEGLVASVGVPITTGVDGVSGASCHGLRAGAGRRQCTRTST